MVAAVTSYRLLFYVIIYVITETEGVWVGRKCCEYSTTDECRSACLQARSKADITSHCRSSEKGLDACIFKQQSRQQCCGRRSNASSLCRHQCDDAFRAESGPTTDDVAQMTSRCGVTMGSCLRNFTIELRRNSNESMHCCDRATKPGCKASCRHILRTETSDQVMADKLDVACGPVMPHEPMWKCFMHDSKPLDGGTGGVFLREVQCCSRAVSKTCDQLCQKIYSEPWIDVTKWDQFKSTCEYGSRESKLTQCLAEVSEPCQMGCSGLSFCSNFNNRPTSLFRSCNAFSDEIASDDFRLWSDGVIRTPFAEIPVHNIKTCQPEQWKAVACALQIKPCSRHTGESIICRSDCLQLLYKCADFTRFPARMTVAELCDLMSPADQQTNCIAISTYTRPSHVVKEMTSNVTQPCLSNPCPEGEVCVINRSPCDVTESCPTYHCLPGCRMGHGSEFIVPVGSVVRVEDRSRGEGCFRSCTCVTSGDLVYCESLPCTDKRQSCKLAGQVKSHGTSFYVDCNFCSCFSGNVTCTKRQCMTSHSTLEDKRRFTGVPCNCKPYYTPVCGSNGVTYRSLCVARCLGMAHHHIQPGACSQLDPCSSNPCPPRERCIATPRVCLTHTNRCQQYECLPRNKQCPRLLSSAILPQGRKAFKHRRRQLDYQDILSSSHFFSNSDYLSKNNAVCDVNNKQYDNICKLVRSRRFKKISHKGNCDAACPSDGSRRVCGHDHVTYNSSCVAMATGIFPDYVGPCRPISYGTDGELSTCAGVKCAALSNPECKPVTPPGSCCPICAGLLRVLISTPHLMAIPQRSWKGPVTVRDIVWILRRHLNVLECATYGQLTTEGDLVIMTLSTINKPSLLQTKACSSEAERLSRLINSRSPTLTSDLILSTLTAATWTSTDKDNSSSYMTSSLMMWVLALLAHYLCWYVT
ncbi:reversion-inducing cysteine-rich protein with Kazal motifs isoform X2 [Ciona intestinalis]